MPSAMALMSEYSPPRLRTLMVTLAACGFSFGGAAGGFVAAGFIDSFGWQAVFLAGGVTPLLLFPFLWCGCCLNRCRACCAMHRRIARLRKVTARMLPDWQPPLATVEQNELRAGQQTDGGRAVPQWLCTSDPTDLGDLLCQPDLAVFHDQLAAVAAAGKWPDAERSQSGDVDVPVCRHLGRDRHGLVCRPARKARCACCPACWRRLRCARFCWG